VLEILLKFIFATQAPPISAHGNNIFSHKGFNPANVSLNDSINPRFSNRRDLGPIGTDV
jgi:hypothetical protein